MGVFLLRLRRPNNKGSAPNNEGSAFGGGDEGWGHANTIGFVIAACCIFFIFLSSRRRTSGAGAPAKVDYAKLGGAQGLGIRSFDEGGGSSSSEWRRE